MSAALSHAQIAALIPHHGAMCLLHEVTHWDASAIVCRAQSHRLADNPLREEGRLHAVCGVEYAAQAMAVHGALLKQQSGLDADSPRGGRLAAIRSLDLMTDRLDTCTSDLEVHATQLMGDANSMVYAFSVQAGGQMLVQGKATVILVAE
jgi:predicted hotdog family 3-hydroxylacyl-ACP dehydratase